MVGGVVVRLEWAYSAFLSVWWRLVAYKAPPCNFLGLDGGEKRHSEKSKFPASDGMRPCAS